MALLDLAAALFSHLLLELGIATFQIVAHLVRLDFLLAEDLAHRALNQPGETFVPRRRSVLACMTCQKPRRPQLMRIAVLLGLVARQRHQPGFRLRRNRWLLARSGSVIERHQRPIGQRPFDAALDRLMMNSHPLCDGKKRWVLAISQKHLSTLHPTRRLSPRPRNGHQPRDLLICHPHLKGLTPCCHHTAPRSALPKRGIHQQHSSSMDAGLIEAGFTESVV
jgi:hypothetical protein